MSAHVSLNLSTILRKSDKMRGLQHMFNKINNTGARMIDSIYHMPLELFCNHIFGCYEHHFITLPKSDIVVY